ncbi:MAG: hypothetical protein PHC52_12860 [Syntrophales bacterium]|nr:hypothetical protein [Syntrophales bacterium]
MTANDYDEIQRLRIDLEARTKQRDELEQALAAKDAELVRLRTEVAAWESSDIGDLRVELAAANERIEQLRAENEQLLGVMLENERLRAWVSDLQSGMYINCVYCGHRYGPKENTPVSMAEVLKQHVEGCPKHPMSALKAENERLKARIAELEPLARERDQFLALARQYEKRLSQQTTERSGGLPQAALDFHAS